MGWLDRTRFEVQGIIGRGGQSVVLRARDPTLDQIVALKTVPLADPEEVVGLKDEFRLVADIVHPNLCELYELGLSDGNFFVVMELVEGTDLPEHLAGLAPAERASRVAALLPQLVGALGALHDRGIVHGDIKPRNMRVTPEGRLVLLDYGFARRVSHGSQSAQTVPGTLAYVAPEAPDGTADRPADWFSVGIVLYEAITGARPFDGSPAETIAAKRLGRYPPMTVHSDGTPAWLARLIDDLLRPAPAVRPDAAEVRSRLRDNGLSLTARDSPSPFVGREREAAWLAARIDEAVGGMSQLVRVQAPSGAGKTTLLDHVLDSFLDRQLVTVLRGRCHPAEAVPFNALDAVIDGLAAHFVARPDLVAACRIDPGPLVAMFPVLGRVWPASLLHERRLDSLELRRRSGLALGEMFALAARAVPLVIVIDDAHWGDEDSASVLSLALAEDIPRLALVLAYRNEDAGASGFLRAFAERPATRRQWRERVLELGPLPDRAAGEIVRAHRPMEPPEVVERLVRDCEGSPLLLEELCYFASSAAVGPDFQALVRAKLDALPRTVERIAQLAAFSVAPLSLEVLVTLAGSDADARSASRRLQRLRILRAVRTSRGARVDVHHDRIRQAIQDIVPEPDRRGLHAALADALGADPDPSPEALAVHNAGADRMVAASRYAEIAAHQALNALAFLRAAELFRQALGWDASDVTRRGELRAGRARALYAGGRCSEAGPEFDKAAADAPSATLRWEMQCMAVDSYLAAGHIEAGLRSAKALGRDIGLAVNHSTPGAFGRIVWNLLALMIRGPRLAASDGVSTARRLRDQARADLAWSLGKGLIYVQPMQGANAAMTSLRLALRVGDAHRAGRAMAFVGAGILWHMPGQRGRAQALVAQAERLSGPGEPYLRAMSFVWRGFAAAYGAEWRVALDLADEGLSRLRELPAGVSWERVVASGLVAWALQWTGEFVEGGRRALAALREATDAGDLYGQVVFRQMLVSSSFASGELATAREHIDWIERHWHPGTYSIPEFYTVWFASMLDLYEDRVESARMRFGQTIGAFKRAGGYRAPPSRMDALIHEVRLLLASESPLGRAAGKRLRTVTKRLAREKRPDGRAHAAVIRAALAAQEGKPEAAVRELELAMAIYERLGLSCHAACAARVRATVTREAMAIGEMDTWLQEHGIGDPERFSRVLLPIGGAFSRAAPAPSAGSDTP